MFSSFRARLAPRAHAWLLDCCDRPFGRRPQFLNLNEQLAETAVCRDWLFVHAGMYILLYTYTATKK